MIRQIGRVAMVALLTVAGLSPEIVGAHGKVELEDDICVRRLGGSMVHLSAYQPQWAPKTEYCTEIPDEGDTFLVIDLIDPNLRAVPIGVQIIKASSAAPKDKDEEGQTVAYWKPTSHPDGVVRGEANLEKGLYKLVVTAEGLSPSYYILRVQQVDYSQFGRKAMGPIVLLLVLAVIVYEFSKTGRLRNWWASRRT
ncbi:MAG: hypothetical protein NNA21_10500 [Nitrospira sp.]|nr:hypothetical protein [Nitrospira sp.]MCP9462269.1 hypothetical protein [Nitrospira sp.]MCP9474474.1 hypothetical protein [Nitrospira sp.]